MSDKYIVTATSLNIRSEPVPKPSTKIGTLPNGHSVEKLNETNTPPWWKVKTVLDGIDVTGYVSSQFLSPEGVPNITSAHSVHDLEVHLKDDNPNSTRSSESGRAFPLGEPGRPKRTSNDSQLRVSELKNIINWLDVEHSVRYIKRSGDTFCNIYAYDYCYLSGVYLPRVWWTESALMDLSNGKNVVPKYESTVRELNANSLFNWLRDLGKQFGWTRTFDLTALQDSANAGAVCLICAQRKELNRSGHIVAVVPEDGFNTANRDTNGTVVRPLESQAGERNNKYITKGTKWWTSNTFRQFGFWIHA